MSTRARGSPNPGTGRPQYVSSRNAARFSRATCSRHSTRRGHARQSTISRLRVRSGTGTGAPAMLRVGFAAVRVLLVVNPTASSVTTRARAAVEGILRGAYATDVVETTRRGHAVELARDAVDAGYDVVVVLAGDGTLNEAGGGLAGSDTALAPLPGGSTNVFARTLGIAYAPADAARQLVDALGRGSRRRIGLGVGDRARRPRAPLPLPPRARLRRRHHPADGGAVVPEASLRPSRVRGGDRRHLAAPLRPQPADPAVGRRRHGAATSLAVGPYAVISNSDPYAYVGHRPLRIAPAASLDRALAVTVLRSLRAAVDGPGSRVGRRPGRVPDHTRPRSCSSPTSITWWSPGAARFPWQVDGDYLGRGRPPRRRLPTRRPDARHPRPDCTPKR